MTALSHISTFTTIIIIGIATNIIYQSIKSRKENQKYKAYYDIPSPPIRLPIFGHLPFLGPSFALKVHYWHQKYGPLVRIQMGTQTWLTVSDPAIADELLEKNKHIMMSRPYHRFIDEYYSIHKRGLVYASSENLKYKNARELVLRYISSEAIVDPLIEYEIDDFIERIITTTTTTTTTTSSSSFSANPFLELKLMCINTFMVVSFAKRFDSIDDPIFRDGEVIFDECFPLLGVNGDPGSFLPSFFCFFLFQWIPFLSKKKDNYLSYAINHSHAYLNRMFRYGLYKANAHCLIKEIHAVRHLYDFDDDDIMVIISDLSGIAGELPPTAFTWALAMLMDRLDIQEKIRQEVIQYLKTHDDHFPRINDIHHFPYTQSVLKECLRYRCSNNFGVPRKFKQDVTVKGILIPKDTVIAIPAYAMHLNENVYKDANTFDPERFIHNVSTISSSYNTNTDYSDRDVYLFGFGPRHCPGIQMVERQFFYLLVRLFYRCRIESCIDENGNPIKISWDQPNDIGVMLRPPPFNIRAIEISPTIKNEFYLDGDEDEDDE